MAENLPELSNGAYMTEIGSTAFCGNKGGSISDWRSGSFLSWRKQIGVSGSRKDLPAPLKNRILLLLTYPSKPGKRFTPQLMLIADISGTCTPFFSRNGGEIGGI
jgi:hypothetical protein